ncbi:MAG: hypothetical protein V3S26_09985 [Acidimicrobiia bacterium]|jgi:hypothetical protein
MTAIGKTRGSLASQYQSLGFVKYVGVGIVAVAVGVGAVFGVSTLTGPSEAAAHRAAFIRGSQVAENVDALTTSGLAQQAAIQSQAVLESRFEAGLAQRTAIEQQQLLQSRIQAGLAQAGAIGSARSAQDAWQMRGAAMASHVDELIASGLAQQAFMDK